MAALESALDAAQNAPLSPAELLLLAHSAARLYDATVARMAVTRCAGLYWRRSAAFKVAVLAVVADGRGAARKRGRTTDRSARDCGESKGLRFCRYRGSSGGGGGGTQCYKICNKCFKTYQRDVKEGLLEEET